MPKYSKKEILSDGKIKYTYPSKLKRTMADGSIKVYDIDKVVIKDLSSSKRNQIKNSIVKYIKETKYINILDDIIDLINIKMKTPNKTFDNERHINRRVLENGDIEYIYIQKQKRKLADGSIKIYENERKSIVKASKKHRNNKSNYNQYVINRIYTIKDDTIIKNIYDLIKHEDNSFDGIKKPIKSKSIQQQKHVSSKNKIINKTIDQPVIIKNKYEPPIIYKFEGYELNSLSDHILTHMPYLTTLQNYWGPSRIRPYTIDEKNEFENIKNKQIYLKNKYSTDKEDEEDLAEIKYIDLPEFKEL